MNMLSKGGKSAHMILKIPRKEEGSHYHIEKEKEKEENGKSGTFHVCNSS